MSFWKAPSFFPGTKTQIRKEPQTQFRLFLFPLYDSTWQKWNWHQMFNMMTWSNMNAQSLFSCWLVKSLQHINRCFQNKEKKMIRCYLHPFVSWNLQCGGFGSVAAVTIPVWDLTQAGQAVRLLHVFILRPDPNDFVSSEEYCRGATRQNGF